MSRRTASLRAPLVAAAAALALVVAGCGGSAGTVRHGRTHAATTTTTAASTSAATTARAVTYGLGDSPGEFAECRPGDPDCCDPGAGRCDLRDMTGYFDDRLFLRLLTPASAHRIRYVRFFVPYDAVSSWNGSTTAPGCTYSQVLDHPWTAADGVHPAGQPIDELVAGIVEARADGLTPMVTISGYPWAALRPAGEPAFPDPTTTAGYWAYRCGLQGVLGDLARLPAWEQPHVWEAVNEPEVFSIFRGGSATPPADQCDVGASPQPDGPAKAACDEAIASREIHAYAGHRDDTVIAGTFEHPNPSYLAPYAAEIARLMPGAAFPATWSVHDYDEVTDAYAGGGTGELAAFDEALATDSAGRAHSLWITEAGTVLTSTVRRGDCPAVGVDVTGSVGACINGQATRQADAAAAFFSLPAAATAVPITHLFWYQFVGAPLWDSGLTDSAGVPREVYCVFYGAGSCAGSPDAA